MNQLSRRRNFNATGYDKADKTEYSEMATVLKKKIKQLSGLVESSKNVVVMTGSGINTGEDPNAPTFVHLALSELCKANFVHNVVTTNYDNAHRSAGIHTSKLLHFFGNSFEEECEKCHRFYTRSYECRQVALAEHRTGHRCTSRDCGGELLDTLIYDGEEISQRQFDQAYARFATCDLVIVLGTRLRLEPASHLPRLAVLNGAKLVIVNLQETPLDSIAELVIHTRAEELFRSLLKRLSVALPQLEEKPAKFQILAAAKEDLVSIADVSEDAHEAADKALIEWAQQTALKLQQQLEGQNRKGPIVFERQAGKSKTIAATGSRLFYVKNCTACDITVEGVVTKIVLLGCKDCNIVVNSRTVAGTLEIIDCRNVTVTINRAMPTVTLDSSHACLLSYSDEEFFGYVIWADTSKLAVKINDILAAIPDARSLNPNLEGSFDMKTTQFITSMKDGGLVTEEVVREGAGYAVSKSQFIANEDRAIANEAAISRAFASMITSQ
jgi:NAD-dependent SIR2 family protein deacetylase